jgi:hypothetical protein
MPDDDPLPWVIEWRVGPVVLTSLPRADPEEVKRRVSKPFIPFGAAGWRRAGEEDWRPLASLPRSWGLRHPAPGQFVEEEDEEGEVKGG